MLKETYLWVVMILILYDFIPYDFLVTIPAPNFIGVVVVDM